MNGDLAHIKVKYFVGIDISKHTLDFAVIEHYQALLAETITNEPGAIKQFLKRLKQLPGFSLKKALFCFESTGIYGNHLLQCLQQVKALFVVENPLHIKLSMGLVRDKTDEKDAYRIALFAKRHQPELRRWQMPRPEIIRLRQLSTVRDRLVLVGKILKTPLKDQKAFTTRKQAQEVNNASAKALKATQKDLLKIEKSMNAIVKADQILAHLHKLIVSVPGIGTLTAIQLILKTNEFRNINDPKKFACYAGVAPFRSESGLMVGRTRVSSLAAKKIKTLLHICAVNAIRFDVEINAYYKRRTLIDKKPKMSVINAVRNKLIDRVFTCVHQNRLYIKQVPLANESVSTGHGFLKQADEA